MSTVTNDEESNNEQFSDEELSAFKAFIKDFKSAKDAKTNIDELISKWNDLYYGVSKTVTSKIKSKIVMKETAKQIEWQKPNITEPFLATSHPIRVTNSGVKTRSKFIEKYLNGHFTGNFDRDAYIDKLVDVMLREGTVWVRDGWKIKYKDSSETITGTMEEILTNGRDPDKIDNNGDGTFTVTYQNKSLDVNEPTSRICRNEHIFPDPSARSTEELRFMCEETYHTLSELRESGFYSEESLDELEEKLSSKEEGNNGSSLETQRNDDGADYGLDKDYQTEDKARNRIAIIEYWGYYDLNGDKIAEPILCTWAKNEEILLEITENPLPTQSIPYNNAVYSSRSFSLWGNALAYFIGDNQKVKTGIVRGIMDNMSLANNGQKFIKKGTLDYMNFKRMRNGERHIIVNKTDSMEDGSFNQLPSSIFNTLQMVDNETNELSGSSNSSPALSSANLGKDDSAGMQMTQAQQRMASLVRTVSALVGKTCKNWIVFAEVFLDNEQIEELFTENEARDYYVFKNSNQTRIALKVGTDVSRIVYAQQLNMLLQQSRQLGESVPPKTFNKLVAEMFDLFDMHEDGNALREYVPQKTQAQQMAEQISMQKLQLENQKIQADIVNSQVEIELKRSEIAKNIAETEANKRLKYSQANQADANANRTNVDSNLEPAKVIAQLQKDFESGKNNERENTV